MTAKKPAAEKPAAKKPRVKKPLDLNSKRALPKLLAMGRAQEAEREQRAQREAKKPAAPLRGEVAIPPAPQPHWGYSFELDASLPSEERAALEAFFTRFTRLGDRSSILVVGPDTPVEVRRAAFDGNRHVLEVEQLRAHLPSDDVASRTERLRAALEVPSSERWYEAAMLLSTWDERSLPDALAVAEACLASWPDTLRGDIPAWSDRPALQALVRTFGGAVAALRERPTSRAITALYTQDPAGLAADEDLSHLSTLNLSGSSGLGDVMTSCASLGRLTQLELMQPTYTEGTKPLDLKALLKTPSLRELKALSLYGYTLSKTSLDALAGCEQPLERLRIEYGKMKPAAATQLAKLASRKALKGLQLKYNDLGPEGAAVLFAGVDDWSALRVLDISANEIGDEGVVALTRAALTELRWLSLSSNAPTQRLTERAARALAEAGSLAKLDGLFLMGHPIGSAGVAALLTSPALRGLRRLNVSYASASLADVMKKLGDAETVAPTELALGGNDSAKPAKWERATFLREVKNLSVDSLDGRNYAGLLACPHLRSLEVLTLGGCYAHADEAFDALVGAAPLPSLRYLDLTGWKPTQEQARAMARSPLFQSLWGVELMASYVTPEAWRELYDAGVPTVRGVFNKYPANDVVARGNFRDEE